MTSGVGDDAARPDDEVPAAGPADEPASEPTYDQVRSMLGSPVPVVDVGITIGDDDAPYPTVVLDTADRPDVADLARVHATDGIGDITTASVRDDDRVLLIVAVSSPVQCAFGVEFTLPLHRPLLDDAARNSQLLLATSPPSALGEQHPLWLAIDLDGERLSAVLDA